MSKELEFEAGTGAGELDYDYVADKEEMTGLEFPPEFLEFLERQNGGIPKKKYFRVDGKTKVLERFLCLAADYDDNKYGDYDIGVVWSDIEDRLNEYLLPFALVFAGDFLCFNYEENEETPSVVLWHHEFSEEDEPFTTYVADSFSDFLKMLSENKNEV